MDIVSSKQTKISKTRFFTVRNLSVKKIHTHTSTLSAKPCLVILVYALRTNHNFERYLRDCEAKMFLQIISIIRLFHLIDVYYQATAIFEKCMNSYCYTENEKQTL